MATGPGVAARPFGLADRAGLFLYPGYAHRFHPQKKRLAVRLDVRVLRRVHPRLWHHARDGSLEYLAWRLLARRNC